MLGTLGNIIVTTTSLQQVFPLRRPVTCSTTINNISNVTNINYSNDTTSAYQHKIYKHLYVVLLSPLR